MTQPENPDRPAGRRVLQKVTLTLLTGGLAYLVTTLTQQPQIWVITVSIFLAGVAFVIQFLVDFESRMLSLEQKVERLVQQGFAEVNEQLLRANTIAESFGKLQASPALAAPVTTLVRSSAVLGVRGDLPLVTAFAAGEVLRVEKLLRELAGAETAEYLGEDRDWLLGLVRSAEATIDATSMRALDPNRRGFVDDGFWNSRHAQDYLQAQQEAMQRTPKVVVRRLFIVDDPRIVVDPDHRAATDPDFVRTLEMHETAGITVGLIPRAKATLPINDFVLFDGKISYELTAAPPGPDSDSRSVIQHTHLRLNPYYVGRQARIFEEMWSRAVPPNSGSDPA